MKRYSIWGIAVGRRIAYTKGIDAMRQRVEKHRHQGGKGHGSSYSSEWEPFCFECVPDFTGTVSGDGFAGDNRSGLAS